MENISLRDSPVVRPADQLSGAGADGGGTGPDRGPAILRPHLEQVGFAELVQLCAVDSLLYSKTFFPKTVRQRSPAIHQRMWGLMEDPTTYLLNLQSFRGSAKTTIARLFVSKMIAYGISYTVLWLSKSEPHAIRNLDWLRRQVEFNTQWAGTFGLEKGNTWQSTVAEVRHHAERRSAWVLSMGIEGSVRGINIDDRRPDLIVLDDVIADENSATVDMRTKVSDLILGAVRDSLAPKSEAPDSKMLNLCTPQHLDDFSMQAMKDPEFKSLRLPCWTLDTEDLPINERQSAWEERFPTAELVQRYYAAIARGKAHLWARELECRIVSPSTRAFPVLPRYYDLMPPREEMVVVLTIDPVPPPSEVQIAKGLRDKDYEALAVVGLHKTGFYLLEYALNRGHTPDWTVAEFMRLSTKWNPRKVIVESVAYQRTLAWLLRKAMERHNRYWVIEELSVHGSKYDRIVDPLSGVLAEGRLLCRQAHGDFVSQVQDYPSVSFDDLLESVANAVRSLTTHGLIIEGSTAGELIQQGPGYEPLNFAGGAP